MSARLRSTPTSFVNRLVKSLRRPGVIVALMALAVFSVAFYLLSDYYPPGLEDVVAVDSVDVGNPWSELSHAYRPVTNYSVKAVLYYPDGSGCMDDYVEIVPEGYELFYVNSVPGQDLIIAKRYDNTSYPLSLSVFSDGVYAGDVETMPSACRFCVGDQVFVIPGEYVTGDETQIKINYVETEDEESEVRPSHRSFHYFIYVKGSRFGAYAAALIKSLIVSLAFYLIMAYRKTIIAEDRYLLPLLFLVSIVPSALFSHYILSSTPHSPDEITQLYQAKLLLREKLYLTSISDPDIDRSLSLEADSWYLLEPNIFLSLREGRIYGKYLILYPLLLAVTLFFNAAFLLNPLIGGFSAVALFCLGREVYGSRKIAVYSAFLMALSPFFMLMSSSFMNNQLSMLLCILFTLTYLRSLRSNGSLDPMLSGLFLGLLINVRVYNAVLFVLPFILFSLVGKGVTFRKLMHFSSGLILPLILFLSYNYLITGNIMRTPFQYFNESELPGFGMKVNEGGVLTFGSPGHTLGKGFLNTAASLGALDGYLFGGFGLLYLAALMFLLSKKSRADYLMALIILSTVVGYFAYYYHHQFFGPRYYYELMPFIILLAVRSFGQLSVVGSKTDIYPVLFIACLLASSAFVYSSIRLHSSYYGFDSRLVKLLDALKGERKEARVIFLSSPADYMAALNQNTWDFDESVIFLKCRGRYNDQALVDSNFPGRDCYILRETKYGYALQECLPPKA